MACNISKQTTGSSKFSGSLAKSVLFFGVLAIGYSGSGLFVNSSTLENGNAAADYTPILTSDISEQF